MEMDEADRRILRAIQAQPELTIRELGDLVGLSHSPCWRRLERLREKGVIGERRYVVDHQAVGYEVFALCFVKASEHSREKLKELEDAVQTVPEILRCYSLSGEHDYIMEVLARNIREYEETVKNKILELPNILSLSTSFALKHVKENSNIPV
ncbi:MAG: Lrp/AsnC family transcriptional regulator [Pseudomonadota bacterium]